MFIIYIIKTRKGNQQLSKEFEVDEQKVENIIEWILWEEKTNLRKGKKSDDQMIQAIQKRIEEELKCYLNK